MGTRSHRLNLPIALTSFLLVALLPLGCCTNESSKDEPPGASRA